jgi:tRNA pseudouridine13 synthase
MHLRSSAHLPGTGGRLIEAAAEEILAKKPAGTGEHFWLKVQKDGLGSQQAREAIARSVNVPVELVSDAGNRDRQVRFTQWFSLPVEPVEHEGPLRRAGAHGKMHVLELTKSHKPFTAACVERIRWKTRIKDANLDDGYLKAKAILDHLRVMGIPNYAPENFLGPDAQWVKWGRLLLKGERLPAQVQRSNQPVSPGSCLRAVQFWLFNRWVAARIADGWLGGSLSGDLVSTRSGKVDLVGADDVLHMDKRIATWEASVLGPLFGGGMPETAFTAAARENEVLEAAEVPEAALHKLTGARRALRVQPQKVILDLEKNDLLVSCELPADAPVSSLIDELTKAARE